jgi:hypothetical protein
MEANSIIPVVRRAPGRKTTRGGMSKLMEPKTRPI